MRYCSLCLTAGLLTAAFAIPSAAFAATTSAAHVYVQTKNGVYVLNANTDGQLTPVSGSPFADTGEMEAVRGDSLLISVGTNYLHSYKVMPNGAVGPQLSQINTAAYGGNECGNTDNSGSILDHTGQYFSVELFGTIDPSTGQDLCDAWQTYKVASNGQFTFLGASVNNDTSPTLTYEYGALDLPLMTVSGNNKYTYGAVSDPDGSYFAPFLRASAGDITLNGNFTEVDPTPDPSKSGFVYEPLSVAADGSNHLAVIVQNPPNSPYPYTTPAQLASYTIDNATGSVKSTNTWKNMPTVNACCEILAMSPAGNLVASAGPYTTNGVGLFHFNGAAPPTYDTTLLPKTEIDLVKWDNSNHLYALSYATDKLYVFTVTPTRVTPVAGSPYSIPGAQRGAWGLTGFVVVPQ